MSTLTIEEKDVIYYMEEMCDNDGIVWIKKGRIKNLADNTGLKVVDIKKILKILVDKRYLEKLTIGNTEGYLLCA